MSEESPRIRIGLEIHCQLTSLRTKLFCGCSADYREDPPNTHTCPVCLGLPGSLPVLNRGAIAAAIKIALALGSRINERIIFFRKNYFYPDMPKNFQISQYDRAGGVPLAEGGQVTIDEDRRVRIRRIHLEEDPGKLIHIGTIDASAYTLIDYNRSGVALAEIVTEPDLTSPREARIFLQRLRSILEHLGVSDGSLEGAMRCDANISLASGARVEVKNISSFKEVERALTFEMMRQEGLIRRGLGVERETRHWDETRRITVSLREKEEEQDYRYFPEPDLPCFTITEEEIERGRAEMPELPDARRQRFIQEYRISPLNAGTLSGSKALADLFEECVKLYPDPRDVSNWLVGDFLAYLNDKNLEVEDSKMTPRDLAKMLQLIQEGTISGKIAKMILPEMIATGRPPEAIIEEKGLTRIASPEYVEEIVERIFQENLKAVKDALQDEKAIHYLIGLLMKATQGRTDPKLAKEIIEKRLKEELD